MNKARRKALLDLISKATGHAIGEGAEAPEEGDELPLDLAQDLDRKPQAPEN
jgi:hypothetical protein